ncbi:MAG: hypothetical protein RJA70_4901, partial [Pseudomonadota bacterium]
QHANANRRDEIGHLARLQMGKLLELRGCAIELLNEDAVQREHVQMWIKSKVGIDALHRGNSPALQLASSGLRAGCRSGFRLASLFGSLL